MIAEGAGKHFDPDITFAFVEISETFREIALNFNDHELFD
jgi:HD-GYP domain-containing protein (c-di-GMP phosphodiesterase class II)